MMSNVWRIWVNMLSTCQLFYFHNGRSRTWKFKKKIPTGLVPLHATFAQNPICKAKLITNRKGYDPFFPDFVKNMHTNDEAQDTFFLPALSLVSLLANAAKTVIAAIQTESELQ